MWQKVLLEKYVFKNSKLKFEFKRIKFNLSGKCMNSSMQFVWD